MKKNKKINPSLLIRNENKIFQMKSIRGLGPKIKPGQSVVRKSPSVT